MKFAAELDNKINMFQRETGTKKTLFLTMVTSHGVSGNEYYTGRVLGEVVMRDLFR